MNSRDIYKRVQQQATMGSEEEAQKATHDVLSSIVPLLSHDELTEFARELPPDIQSRLAKTRGAPDDLIDREVFIGRLVNSMDTEYGYDWALGGMDLSSSYADDDAAKRAQAVFSVLGEVLPPNVAQRVRSRLPEGVREWWPKQ